jgi:hypothetical protein
MTIKPCLAAAAIVAGLWTPLAAQPPDDRPRARPVIVTRPAEAPPLSLRGFVLGTEENFAAANTFDAVFGSRRQPFIGAGLQAVIYRDFYAEVSVSRFHRTGERAFYFQGQAFPLGLDLTAEIRPIEITGGYRFHISPDAIVVPYAGAGFGWYSYEETSPSSDPEEDVKTRHRGIVMTGGAEVRLHRWVHVAVDAQYTRIPGILGLGGISKAAGEDDLGGLAGRLKLIVGR